jgi:hypothetical protein
VRTYTYVAINEEDIALMEQKFCHSCFKTFPQKWKYGIQKEIWQVSLKLQLQAQVNPNRPVI